jgi:hypothetical protein
MSDKINILSGLTGLLNNELNHEELIKGQI